MKRYSDPYAAGFALGLVLLASFAFAGRGVGVSGAFVWSAAAAAGTATHHTLPWVVYEVLGILVGGFLSALLAKRLKATVERGPRITTKTRLATAFAGGAVMGTGAYLARGCTSGLALTGGALLGVGSWLFVLAAFAAAYALAPFLRRVWQ